jgi:hypothetical protein
MGIFYLQYTVGRVGMLALSEVSGVFPLNAVEASSPYRDQK